MFRISFAVTFLFIVSTYAATLTIINNCPATIQVFLNNVNSVRINSQSRAIFTGLSPSSSAQLSLTPNAGTFASFYFPVSFPFFYVNGQVGLSPSFQYGFYYIVRDPGLFNGGVSIAPTNVTAVCNIHFMNCCQSYIFLTLFFSGEWILRYCKM